MEESKSSKVNNISERDFLALQAELQSCRVGDSALNYNYEDFNEKFNSIPLVQLRKTIYRILSSVCKDISNLKMHFFPYEFEKIVAITMSTVMDYDKYFSKDCKQNNITKEKDVVKFFLHKVLKYSEGVNRASDSNDWHYYIDVNTFSDFYFLVFTLLQKKWEDSGTLTVSIVGNIRSLCFQIYKKYKNKAERNKKLKDFLDFANYVDNNIRFALIDGDKKRNGILIKVYGFLIMNEIKNLDDFYRIYNKFMSKIDSVNENIVFLCHNVIYNASIIQNKNVSSIIEKIIDIPKTVDCSKITKIEIRKLFKPLLEETRESKRLFRKAFKQYGVVNDYTLIKMTEEAGDNLRDVKESYEIISSLLMRELAKDNADMNLVAFILKFLMIYINIPYNPSFGSCSFIDSLKAKIKDLTSLEKMIKNDVPYMAVEYPKEYATELLNSYYNMRGMSYYDEDEDEIKKITE